MSKSKFSDRLYDFADFVSDAIDAGTVKAKEVAPKVIDTIGGIVSSGIYAIPQATDAVTDFIGNVKEQAETQDNNIAGKVMDITENMAGSVMDAVADATSEVSKAMDAVNDFLCKEATEIGMVPPDMEIKYGGEIFTVSYCSQHWCFSGDETQRRVYQGLSYLRNKLGLHPGENDCDEIVTDGLNNYIEVRFGIEPDAVTVIAEDKKGKDKFKVISIKDDLDDAKYSFDLFEGEYVYFVTAHFIDQDKPYIGYANYSFLGLNN